jgi:beta-lactamase regulating signal transducer with metallopeptidase domain
MSEALDTLLRVNLAMAAAVALAMLLRRPARRLFGPRIAYRLWALAPLAAAAMLAPVRTVTVAAPAMAVSNPPVVGVVGDFGPAPVLATGPDLSTLLTGLWIAGAVLALAHLIWRQRQFGHAVRAGRAGPAVVGVLRPRVITPRDFAGRYTSKEQLVVLAHEKTHIARQDSRTNALVALARCLNWFNPLVHVLAHYLRIDQELACDAQVVAAHPAARRSYAEAMLKTQLAARPLPIGCYWPAQAAHPLAERIGLLSQRNPRGAVRALGAASVAVLVLAAACAAWAARPTQVVAVAAPQVRLAPAPIAESSGPTLADASPARTPVLQRVSTAPQPVSETVGESVAAAEAAPYRPPPGFTEVTDDPAKAGPARRLLPDGFFGPPRKIYGLANWSQVEAGSAVRVLATMKDPDGVPLTTDLTAFGSQARYRLGYIKRDSSHYKLFTSVVQHGDRFEITAGLNKYFSRLVTGSIELADGETGTITLPNGLQVNVTPTVRPETAEEAAEARGRARVDVSMHPRQF